MTVLTRTECKRINEIVDYILIHTNISVADVKEKFGLSKEEYEMISELMMPPLRWYNRSKYYETGIKKLISQYKDQDRQIEEQLRKEQEANEKYNEDENLRAS